MVHQERAKETWSMDLVFLSHYQGNTGNDREDGL